MIYFKPSSDFFGPAADQLRCQIMFDTLVVHLIPDCGQRVVQAINALALAIKASKSQPEWQRRNGSIVYKKLPSSLKSQFKENDFDEKGYINLRKLHVITSSVLYGESRALRSQQKRNHCRLPGCREESNPIQSVTTCAALTYRLAEGRAFNVRNHSYAKKIPIVDLSDSHYIDLMEIQDSLDRLFKTFFGRIWDSGKALQVEREEREANAFGAQCLSFLRGLFSQNLQPNKKSSIQGNALACCLILLCLFFSQSLFEMSNPTTTLPSKLFEMGNLLPMDTMKKFIWKAPHLLTNLL